MIRLASLVLAVMLLAMPAKGRELVHLVTAGDTPESLAREYYGDEDLATAVLLYNQISREEIVEGISLRIPVAIEHQVKVGDTWSGLAETYWLDSKLAAELAELSGANDAKLRAGSSVRIPVLVPHRIRPGETLAALSRREYGGPQHADALARLNGIADPRRLRVEDIVRTPLLALGITRPNLEKVSAAPASAAGEKLADVAAAPSHALGIDSSLEIAVSAYRDGNYGLALARLEALRGSILANGSRSEQQLLLRHLTFLYAAYDRPAELCESFRALLHLQPELSWDPDQISPKIARLSASCDGG